MVLYCCNEANLVTVQAISQAELESIEQLRATNDIVTSSLDNDLALLTAKYDTMRRDNEIQKRELVDAILSKERALREMADLKERGGGIGPSNYEKAQAHEAIEQEKRDLEEWKAKKEAAQGEVEEVRRQSQAGSAKDPTAPNSPKRHKFFNALGKTLFRGYKAGGPSKISDSTSDQATFKHAEQNVVRQRAPVTELEKELAAIGLGTPIDRPLISPRRIPLPMSPSKLPPTTHHLQLSSLSSHY